MACLLEGSRVDIISAESRVTRPEIVEMVVVLVEERMVVVVSRTVRSGMRTRHATTARRRDTL